jgi:hypothetical protein
MRDKTHNEQIERWAHYVKENPDSWKTKVKALIDSQITMAQRFYRNLAQTPEGREKIKKLRQISKP